MFFIRRVILKGLKIFSFDKTHPSRTPMVIGYVDFKNDPFRLKEDDEVNFDLRSLFLTAINSDDI